MKTINFKENKGIISLAVILGIGFFALAIALTLSSRVFVEVIKNRNIVFGDRSFYTAEVASREGIYQYIKSGLEQGNLPLSINQIETTSTSFSINPSPRGWAYREVWGDAENSTYRKVKSTLLLDPSAAAFDHAIYAEDDLGIKGNINIEGNVFSNGAISCDGSSNDVDGSIFSSSLIDDKCNASSTHPNVKVITPPVIDPYYYAERSSCTSTAKDVKKDCLSGKVEGVVFVEDPGETAVLNGADLTGNLTIIGDLELGGNSKITASSTALEEYAAVVVDGNLKISGTVRIYGLVYVTGSTTFAGGTPHIYGSFVSIGGIADVAGTPQITYVPLSDVPGGFSMNGDPVIVDWWEE